MLNSSSKNKKIAFNTLLLYARMFVVLLINLYTVRIVLKALGEEDYGIYNVVAGIITMLASVTSVFSSATQRFLSYSLGEGNDPQLKRIFSASTNIFFAISIITILLGETVGLWFINSHLVIPVDRLAASNWIFQFSLLSFMASMLSTPYLAASIAHEDMALFAIVTTIDAILKLIFAFAIPYVPFDHMAFYGFYLLIIQIFTLLFYVITCRRRYSECHYSKSCDWKLHKEILTFSGWILFSSFAVIGTNQVIAILINIFFGPLANAALAIAIQVNSALSTFCNSFIMAVRPPMIKAYAEQRFEYLKRIFSVSNKFTYYCMLIIAIPLILEMPTVLHIWLGNTVTYQMVLFCQLGVIYSVVLSLCNPISIIVQATGKMKLFTVPVESVTLLIPIVVFVLFKIGLAAESSFYALIALVIIAHIVRLIFLKKVFPAVSLRNYLFDFVMPAILVTFFTVLICVFVHRSMLSDFNRLICICIASIALIVILSLYFGLNRSEKILIRSLIKRE